LGSLPGFAHARASLGEILLAAGDDSLAGRGRDELAHAAADAHRLELTGLESRIARLANQAVTS
jgi:hypothetical protein